MAGAEVAPVLGIRADLETCQGCARVCGMSLEPRAVGPSCAGDADGAFEDRCRLIRSDLADGVVEPTAPTADANSPRGTPADSWLGPTCSRRGAVHQSGSTKTFTTFQLEVLGGAVSADCRARCREPRRIESGALGDLSSAKASFRRTCRFREPSRSPTRLRRDSAR